VSHAPLSSGKGTQGGAPRRRTHDHHYWARLGWSSRLGSSGSGSLWPDVSGAASRPKLHEALPGDDRDSQRAHQSPPGANEILHERELQRPFARRGLSARAERGTPLPKEPPADGRRAPASVHVRDDHVRQRHPLAACSALPDISGWHGGIAPEQNGARCVARACQGIAHPSATSRQRDRRASALFKGRAARPTQTTLGDRGAIH
jgi:hypothetical protein